METRARPRGHDRGRLGVDSRGAVGLELRLHRRRAGAGAPSAPREAGSARRAGAGRALLPGRDLSASRRRRCCAHIADLEERHSLVRDAWVLRARTQRLGSAAPRSVSPLDVARTRARLSRCARLIPIDGSQGEGGGQILRTALALSAVTGPGLRDDADPRAAASVPACGLSTSRRCARSPWRAARRSAAPSTDRPTCASSPGPSSPASSASRSPRRARRPSCCRPFSRRSRPRRPRSRVEVTGGTHVPASPSFDYLARHWAGAVAAPRPALRASTLERAGFYPPGGGEVRARGRAVDAAGARSSLEERGALVAVRGVSGAARAQGRRRAAPARRRAGAALGGAAPRGGLGRPRRCPPRRPGRSCSWRRSSRRAAGPSASSASAACAPSAWATAPRAAC